MATGRPFSRLRQVTRFPLNSKTVTKVRRQILKRERHGVDHPSEEQAAADCKDTIAQVYRLERRAEKAKYAAIGAGIGAAAGAGIGGAKAASGSSSDDGIYTLVGLVFGTGFGATWRHYCGVSAKRKHVLIYEAP